MSGPDLTPEQVASLRALDANGPPLCQPLRRLDLARMVAEPPPPVPWVVEHLAARGMLTALSGKPGDRKSLLCLALAVGVATATSEGGYRCREGRVVIVDAENGEGEIHRRVHTLQVPPERIAIYEADGFDLASGEHLALIGEVLEAERPALLVLDSYRTLWLGEENDSAAVTGLLQPLRALLRAFEVAGLLPVHVGRQDLDYRGSEALQACIEFGFKIGSADDDPEPDRRYVECWKARPLARPDTHWLRFGEERGLVLIDEAEPFEERPRGRPARGREQVAPLILKSLADGAASQAELARAVGRDPSDGTFRRSLAALAGEGAIRRREGLWTLTAEIVESATPTPRPVGAGVSGTREWQHSRQGEDRSPGPVPLPDSHPPPATELDRQMNIDECIEVAEQAKDGIKTRPEKRKPLNDADADSKVQGTTGAQGASSVGSCTSLFRAESGREGAGDMSAFIRGETDELNLTTEGVRALPAAVDATVLDVLGAIPNAELIPDSSLSPLDPTAWMERNGYASRWLRCGATRHDGSSCRNKRRAGSRYCGIHGKGSA